MPSVVASLTLHFQAKEARAMRLEQYAREDAYRLFDKRMEAYAALYLHIGSARQALTRLARANEEDRESRMGAKAARHDLWADYTLIRLIGSQEVLDATAQILFFVDKSIETRTFDADGFIRKLDGFRDSARKELIRTDGSSSQPSRRANAVDDVK
ncbi:MULTISPECIES: hypothetical protein [Amycolatopsis]|uniref:Uncharacterized protein n=1 Tax=Amycolatopsis dongchuanensis TaxID=1070866 RepID=A0ABP9PTK8_9PSEU